MKLQRSVALLCVIALSATMLPLNIARAAAGYRQTTHHASGLRLVAIDRGHASFS